MDDKTVAIIKRLVHQHRQHDYIVRLAIDVPLSVDHIHGGHLNHVGRVKSADGKKSCIVKVYMNYVKFLGPEMPIETERCEREYLASHYFRSIVPDCCPLSYFYDDVHNIGFLEDFPEHQEWGQTLCTHCDVDSGAKLADILVALHGSSYRGKLRQTEFDMLSKKFCALPKQVNFLCQAQFVKPLVANHRDYKPQCQEAVRLKVDDIINDNVVITAAENCRKWMSPENGNCCIHGDLHLENVLYSIRDKNIMLIDTDCVRVGPESYDIGLLVSNYVLLYHYHQELCHAEVVWKGPVHTQLMTDMMQLINITLTRYMDGMCHALQDKFESQQVWRQILHFMAVEVIGWIAGPASFDYIDAHPKVMMKCLDTAMSILHVMPNNAAELCNILSQH